MIFSEWLSPLMNMMEVFRPKAVFPAATQCPTSGTCVHRTPKLPEKIKRLLQKRLCLLKTLNVVPHSLKQIGQINASVWVVINNINIIVGKAFYSAF
jgi:hypothetical protein